MILWVARKALGVTKETFDQFIMMWVLGGFVDKEERVLEWVRMAWVLAVLIGNEECCW